MSIRAFSLYARSISGAGTESLPIYAKGILTLFNNSDGRTFLSISNTHANAPTLWFPAIMLDEVEWWLEINLALKESAKWGELLE